MTESEVIRGVRDILRKKGAWYMRNFGVIGQRKGIPDIIACYRGFFLGIECKGTRGSLSSHQVEELMGIDRANGIGLVVKDPLVLQDLLDSLDRMISLMDVTPRDDTQVADLSLRLAEMITQGMTCTRGGSRDKT